MQNWKFFEKVAFWWALVLGTVSFVVFITGMGLWISNNSSNVASWVQAVGSIAAVGAVFIGIQYQHIMSANHQKEMNEKSQRRLDYKSSIVLFQLAVEAEIILNIIKKQIVSGDISWRAQRSFIERLIEKSVSININSMENIRDVVQISVLQTSLSALGNSFRIAVEISDEKKNAGEIPENTFKVVMDTLDLVCSSTTTLANKQHIKLKKISTASEFEDVELINKTRPKPVSG